MKNKLSSISLLIMFIATISFAFAGMQGYSQVELNSNSFFDQELRTEINQIQSNYNNAALEQRWGKPLEFKIVIEQLYSYKNRVLISFFDFEDRNIFQNLAQSLGVIVDKAYYSIPAISISYSDTMIEKLELNRFDIKYTYPIGTYGYYIPQNLDTELPKFIELKDIREVLEIDKIHDLGYYGKDVVVAVLDSGINVSNAPGLETLYNSNETKVIFHWDAGVVGEDISDSSGHGTHIASILAGNGNFTEDGKTIQTEHYGIAPDAYLLNIKVLDKTNYGKDEWLYNGFDKSIEMGADIISASLTSITYEKMGDPLEELMRAAYEQDIFVVASAGNYGPLGGSVGAPALWDYVIAVGASDNIKDLAVYSARGPTSDLSVGIDIIAPGSRIGGSDARTGGRKYVSGTSVSTPIVSGILALLRDAFPEVENYRQKYEIAILETADDLGYPVVAQGRGMIDPYNAFKFLQENADEEIFTTNPSRISEENLFFYSCVEGDEKSFNFKLMSSNNQDITTNIMGDSEFVEVAQTLTVEKGWNDVFINITIPMGTQMRNINASICLTNGNFSSCEIEIDITTRYFGGTVLFDISHENDTRNSWFSASSPYGSHLYLYRRLLDRGFHINVHTIGEILIPGDTNILILSDPELNYTDNEINEINNFVVGGGSLLFLVNSIRFSEANSTTYDPLIQSNYYTCNKILSVFNISVASGVYYAPVEAITNLNNGILTEDKFLFWGTPLNIIDPENNPNSKILAYFNIIDSPTQFPAVVSTEIGEGRVIAFGSGYPFTDFGLVKDMFEIFENRTGLGKEYDILFFMDKKNSQIVNDTIEWLISAHRPSFSIETIPENTYIRSQINLRVTITKNNNLPYIEEYLTGTVLYGDNTIEQIVFTRNAHDSVYIFYETNLEFNIYGWHVVFLPLKLDNHTAHDGRIDIFCNVKLWDKLSTIQAIAGWILVGVVATLIAVPIIRVRFRKNLF